MRSLCLALIALSFSLTSAAQVFRFKGGKCVATPTQFQVIHQKDTIRFFHFPESWAPITQVKRIGDTLFVVKDVASCGTLSIRFDLRKNGIKEPQTYLEISDSSVFFREALKYPISYLYVKGWNIDTRTGYFLFAQILQNANSWPISTLDSLFNAPRVLPLHAIISKKELERVFMQSPIDAQTYVKLLIEYGFRVLNEQNEPIRAMDIGYYATKMYNKMPEGHRLMAYVYRYLGFKTEASLKYKTFLRLMQEEGRMNTVLESEQLQFEP